MLANGSQDETIKLSERRIVRQKQPRVRLYKLFRTFSITSIGGSTPV